MITNQFGREAYNFVIQRDSVVKLLQVVLVIIHSYSTNKFVVFRNVTNLFLKCCNPI